MTGFPAPTAPRATRADVLLGYLDFFRVRVLAKVESLPAADRDLSVVASGWTARQLVWHLANVERRWLEWGFEGAAVTDPWADQTDGRWAVPAGLDPLDALRAQGLRTAEIVGRHSLDEVGAPGPRWEGAPPATLERVLLHLVQEYARHLGHLDVVVEIVTAAVGE